MRTKHIILVIVIVVLALAAALAWRSSLREAPIDDAGDAEVLLPAVIETVDEPPPTFHVSPHEPIIEASPQGITGLCNDDGRVTILMPHPERVFLTAQNSWHPADWGPDGPWLRMFRNARRWVD